MRLLAFIDGAPGCDIFDQVDPAVEVKLVDNGSRQQLLEMIGDFHGYIATLRILVDNEVLDRGRLLRLVATPSTGTDHLALARLQEQGITVQSLKQEKDLLERLTSTAELAFGLILTCARHLP